MACGWLYFLNSEETSPARTFLARDKRAADFAYLFDMICYKILCYRVTRFQFCRWDIVQPIDRSEEHTSELQSREKLVCRLLLEKKNTHGARTNVRSTQ